MEEKKKRKRYREYDNAFKKAKYRKVSFLLNKETDAAIIEKLQSVNKLDYLRELIRADIAKEEEWKFISPREREK